MKPGDIISHSQMCHAEGGYMLQKGMNYRIRGIQTVILMSVRSNAPYADQVQENGTVLIYEGHNAKRQRGVIDSPADHNQPRCLPSGRLTENGLFENTVKAYKDGAKPERIKVYEKIKPGIWVYNGFFDLINSREEKSGTRTVFKFKLKLAENQELGETPQNELEHSRMIPSHVKLEVWKRDGGKCVDCGSADNLHYDHDLPFSKGGTSLSAKNIRLLCMRHNLQKSNKIE